MANQTEEMIEEQTNTLADRLKEARNNLGYSRAKLANETGIPAKSIEKFEYGTQEPSVSRLKKLSQALNVDHQWLLDEVNVMGPNPGGNLLDDPEIIPANDDDPLHSIRADLERMDDFRADGFEGVQRQAMALADEILAKLKHFEPNLLLELAEERGLNQEICPTSESILEIFQGEPKEAQEYCGLIEERILDTAILGTDLYSIDRDALAEIASDLQEDHNLEKPRLFGWGDYEEFVPLIRPVLRALAFSGKGNEILKKP